MITCACNRLFPDAAIDEVSTVAMVSIFYPIMFIMKQSILPPPLATLANGLSADYLLPS